jgi:hypothetical protein
MINVRIEFFSLLDIRASATLDIVHHDLAITTLSVIISGVHMIEERDICWKDSCRVAFYATVSRMV